MKLKKIFSTAFLLSGMFFAHSQNVASTANLTSGGLEAGTNGSGNTFYGYQAGKLNTSLSSSNNNTFIGHLSGKNSSGGYSNTFLGYKAGQTLYDGFENVILGASAGSDLYDGRGNVIIGYESASLGNGDYNTILGYKAGYNNDNQYNIFIGNQAGYNEQGSNKLYIENSNSTIPLIWGDFALDQLKLNGKVGIGNGFANFPTTAGSVNVANYNLFVKGGILTEEVRVNLQSNWADYVFSPDYKLKTLDEVENYINENGHLENVPSAKKVKEEGIELGEMVKIQQEKIEELTLYIIQLNKENLKEKEQNKVMLQKLTDLEAKVSLLLSK